MTIIDSFEKTIEIPFEGFIVKVTYPKYYLKGKTNHFYQQMGRVFFTIIDPEGIESLVEDEDEDLDLELLLLKLDKLSNSRKDFVNGFTYGHELNQFTNKLLFEHLSNIPDKVYIVGEHKEQARPSTKYQSSSMCECADCDGTGYSTEAREFRKIFNAVVRKGLLTQGDVNALVAGGCLKNLTHRWSDSKYVVDISLTIPTPEEVMAWDHKNGIGLDSRCISVITEYRLSLFGLSEKCQTCKGEGQTLQLINK